MTAPSDPSSDNRAAHRSPSRHPRDRIPTRREAWVGGVAQAQRRRRAHPDARRSRRRRPERTGSARCAASAQWKSVIPSARSRERSRRSCSHDRAPPPGRAGLRAGHELSPARSNVHRPQRPGHASRPRRGGRPANGPRPRRRAWSARPSPAGAGRAGRRGRRWTHRSDGRRRPDLRRGERASHWAAHVSYTPPAVAGAPRRHRARRLFGPASPTCSVAASRRWRWTPISARPMRHRPSRQAAPSIGRSWRDWAAWSRTTGGSMARGRSPRTVMCDRRSAASRSTAARAFSASPTPTPAHAMGTRSGTGHWVRFSSCPPRGRSSGATATAMARLTPTTCTTRRSPRPRTSACESRVTTPIARRCAARWSPTTRRAPTPTRCLTGWLGTATPRSTSWSSRPASAAPSGS